jgi:two-component system C4-dicarboxylate transport response regulator DctD
MLRVLELREVTPLGTNEVRPVDIRIVAAAKVDLADPGQRKTFREDLYYRLNVVSLSIPPLRERREDIPLLFSYFAERAAQRFQRTAPNLSTEVLRHLREHDWPGNVRELSHFAERTVLGMTAALAPQSRSAETGGSGSLPERLDRIEAGIIRDTLSAHDGNVQETIDALGIPRKTFYDKLQRHGIVRREFSASADKPAPSRPNS